MSFRLKTILGIALIEIVLLAGLIVSGLYYLRSSNETALLQRADVTGRLLATMTSDAVLSMDLASLDALVQQTLSNDGLIYVRVLQHDGTVLAADGDAAALATPFKHNNTIVDDVLDVSYPIQAAGENFGHVEIGLATAQMEQTLAEAAQWMFSIAAVEIILVAVFGLLLGTVLTKQLAKLRAGARRVAAGEFGYQLKVHGRDELADTTASFNRMSQALSQFAADALAAKERAEKGQAYAETVLNDAMNSMPQGVVILAPDASTSFTNKAFQARYAAQKDGRAQAIASNNAEKSWEETLEDGTTLMLTRQPMSDGGTVIVEQDVTDLFDALERNRTLEMELMQTHKMQALGSLAGGIAHEINTPVQFIGDNLKFLSESFTDIAAGIDAARKGKELSTSDFANIIEDMDWDFLSEELPQALKESRGGVETVSRIVQSVKEFSHPEMADKSCHDLRKIIENAATVSRAQWADHATLDIDVGDGLEAVACYPGELGQVFVNLIVNAADAMAETGNTGRIAISCKADGQQAMIEVCDNGPGMSEDVLRQIFNMFFTTKAPGHGTGQGLALCKSIIENKHDGTLSVQSEVGTGSCFKIEVPLHNNKSETRRTAVENGITQ